MEQLKIQVNTYHKTNIRTERFLSQNQSYCFHIILNVCRLSP